MANARLNTGHTLRPGSYIGTVQTPNPLVGDTRYNEKANAFEFYVGSKEGWQMAAVEIQKPVIYVYTLGGASILDERLLHTELAAALPLVTVNSVTTHNQTLEIEYSRALTSKELHQMEGVLSQAPYKCVGVCAGAHRASGSPVSAPNPHSVGPDKHNWDYALQPAYAKDAISKRDVDRMRIEDSAVPRKVMRVEDLATKPSRFLTLLSATAALVTLAYAATWYLEYTGLLEFAQVFP